MAKKKYYQSVNDRLAESRGMERYEMREEERREKKMEKGGPKKANRDYSRGMIREDWNAPALCPREVMQKYWPAGGYYDNGYVSDLFSGVQDQLDQSAHEYSMVKKPSKY